MTIHHYLHLDVFTPAPLSGNQLAVFLEPPVWPDETMQAIAREISFSETTFVYPPVHAGSPAQVRIFTPGGELPMASAEPRSWPERRSSAFNPLRARARPLP